MHTPIDVSNGHPLAVTVSKNCDSEPFHVASLIADIIGTVENAGKDMYFHVSLNDVARNPQNDSFYIKKDAIVSVGDYDEGDDRTNVVGMTVSPNLHISLNLTDDFGDWKNENAHDVFLKRTYGLGESEAYLTVNKIKY